MTDAPEKKYQLGVWSAAEHQLLLQLVNGGCKIGFVQIAKNFGVDEMNATMMVASLIQKIGSAVEVQPLKKRSRSKVT